MVIETTHPATFPERWDTPFDGGGGYGLDPMHTPHPLTPLSFSAIAEIARIGMTNAAQEQQLPIREFQVRSRNFYLYGRDIPREPANADEARALTEAAEAASRQETGRLLERWHGEHLPRIKELHQRMRELDAAGAPATALPALLDEAAAITLELWTIHFRIAFPMIMAMQLFDELYADLFGGSTADAHALLVGGVSESVKAGFGLEELAAAARDLGLEPRFRETAPEALLPALEASAEGQAFLLKLRDYLEAYGLRQDLFELATPTWREEPSFALASVRNALLTGRDTRAEHAALARAADDALEEARQHLAAYPAAVREQFEAMVQMARQGAFLQEEHNFYIDQQGISLARLYYLQLGERLAEMGVLAAPDDVFFLSRDELRGILEPGAPIEAVPALVATRRAAFARAWDLTPPPFIGPPPAVPPGDNPMVRGMLQFWGGPPKAAERPGELQGNPGSRGIATGIARVARTLEEAHHLRPGEILVAITTMPPWTPLFGVAAAVVTETGGPLSHCAVVAREYGIPAVVGAHGATRAIATGQQITVDGGRGVVTLAE